MDTAVNTLTSVGLRVIGALVLYLVGRWLINWMVSLVRRGLERQKVDPTLLRHGTERTSCSERAGFLVEDHSFTLVADAP